MDALTTPGWSASLWTLCASLWTLCASLDHPWAFQLLGTLWALIVRYCG